MISLIPSVPIFFPLPSFPIPLSLPLPFPFSVSIPMLFLMMVFFLFMLFRSMVIAMLLAFTPAMLLFMFMLTFMLLCFLRSRSPRLRSRSWTERTLCNLFYYFFLLLLHVTVFVAIHSRHLLTCYSLFSYLFWHFKRGNIIFIASILQTVINITQEDICKGSLCYSGRILSSAACSSLWLEKIFAKVGKELCEDLGHARHLYFLSSLPLIRKLFCPELTLPL